MDNAGGGMTMEGSLGIEIRRGDGTVETPPVGQPAADGPTGEDRPDTISSFALLRQGLPGRGQSWKVRRWKIRNLPHFLPGWFNVAIARLAARVTHLPVFYGSLRIVTIEDGNKGEIFTDYGLVGLKVVTTAGVTKIVDFLRANDTTTGQNFKYHSLGTGSTAEAVGDTALVTELTTEYAVDNTRPTGTQTNNGATVYRTVGSNVLDGTPGAALREHGIHSASSAGTLLDRTVFAAITLSSGDTFGSTYDLTCAAGG